MTHLLKLLLFFNLHFKKRPLSFCLEMSWGIFLQNPETLVSSLRNCIYTNAQRSKVHPQYPNDSHEFSTLLQSWPCHLATWPERHPQLLNLLTQLFVRGKYWALMILEGVPTDWQGLKWFTQVKVAIERYCHKISPVFQILQVTIKSKDGLPSGLFSFSLKML